MAILLIIFALSGGMIISNVVLEHEMAATSVQARQIVQEMFYESEETADVINFDEMRAAFGNADILAHLLIEGTTIDYLVVQAPNNDFYLHHDIWRNASNAGWIFFDYDVDLSQTDQNWVIYGHNMQRDHKFHSLRRFADYNFLQEHPIITLTTEQGTSYWEIFSFYSTNISFGYNIVNFENTATKQHFLESFVDLSWHNTNVNVTAADKILTLSTCTNFDQDDRYVIHARLKN